MTKFLPAEPQISLAFASCLSDSVSGIVLNSCANLAAFNFLEVISCMKKCGMTIKEIRHFIDLCMQGDVTLNARYDLLDQEEASVVKQIDVLQKQLDFLHYKMWYFKTAIDAGTEDIHMVPSIDGKRVTPKIHEQYQEALKNCHDINELIKI